MTNHKKHRKPLFVALLALIILSLIPLSADAATKKKKKGGGENHKYAALVMDADTGMILYQSNPDKILYPASLTKVMTLLLTFDALESGRLSVNDRIRVSSYAASMSPSKLGLKPGSTIRVEDAIYALVTKSANDISVALAEAIGGSESRFAQMMTQRAASIGMSKSRFYNASGLPNTRQVTTARDMALMARYIIVTYPKYYRYFSKRNFTYAGVNHHNHNRLMQTYPGMDGMKTGYINASGFNLVASAKRGNQRLIGVVFGGKTAVSRNNHMAKLLDDGFGMMEGIRVAKNQSRNLGAGNPGLQVVPMQTTPQPHVTASLQPAIATAAPEAVTRVAAMAPAAGPIIYPPPLPPQKRMAGVQDAVVTPSQGTNMTSLQASSITAADRLPSPAQATVLGTLPAGGLQQQVSLTQNNAVSAPIEQKTWSIQIGAYQSRVVTDQALYQAVKKLPAHLSNAQSLIVPLRTSDAQWVFRARLSGFNREQAAEACRYFTNCITISPQAN